MLKGKNGITLIALVITIIVLLILAGVSVATLMGDNGLLTKAGESKEASEKGKLDDRVRIAYNEWRVSQYTENLQNLKDILEKEFGVGNVINNGDGNWIIDGTEVTIDEQAGKITIGNKTEQKTIADVQNDYVQGNTTVEDEYGNKIVVPDGFKVTNDTKRVTEGIVIEDIDGNQFVWIPVGEIKKDNGIPVTIAFDRYAFGTNGTPTPQGTAVIDTYYQELDVSTYGNATAKGLQGFIDSVNNNGGYYIGRYEASSNGGKVESKANKEAWTNITQLNAAALARNMYTSSNYTSDLVNSYSWDTATVFIQTFGQSNYSRQTRLSSSKLKTGLTGDMQLNINDMASNVSEWTTETYKNVSLPCTGRGGGYLGDLSYTSVRGSGQISDYIDVVRISPNFIFIIHDISTKLLVPRNGTKKIKKRIIFENRENLQYNIIM